MLKRILVVDDDPSVRALLEIVGKRAGFVVDSAVDGLDALEQLRANEYVIVILDLMMPRVNGYDVVQQLRTEPRRPAIVVVTAMTGTFVSDLDPQVVQSIIRKPFDVEMMAAVLTDLAAAMTTPAPAAMPRTLPEARSI
jgi:DNA-binding response OmpR family regulator